MPLETNLEERLKRSQSEAVNIARKCRADHWTGTFVRDGTTVECKNIKSDDLENNLNIIDGRSDMRGQ
jgi:hypothetical protein